ncbi:hypothetical protein DM01DRAFT_1135021 [Hesseltinella vesiculosa]|uniref:Uncharacterized protein n=1 Tax=Hesseltinella vesiculosa TaxID=101127 RepID=A0A1X2G8W5_9FUNG|nr:hypothetical protein DM01DRAFT_1135021 [Hesseltinella vesiculosa]
MKLYTVCLCVLWCLGMVAGQQYAPPTFLWQSLVTPQPYNTGYIYSHNATLKYYSQDFQTVYMSNDNFGHNERVLINLGDACNIKNYNDVQALNNFSIQQFTVSQNLMGLVSRGGCDSWQVKLNNIQSLGQFFQLTGVLLYDNVTYPQSQLIQHNPSTTNTPTWPSSFDPPQRNISLMLDNDLRNYSSYLAVYFAPNEFGTAMLGKLNAYSFGPTVSIAQQQYVQMATYFQEQAMTDNPSPTSSSNGSSSDGGGSLFDTFVGNRGYIAYLVAAGAAIVFGTRKSKT